MTQSNDPGDLAREDEWIVVRCQLGERPAFDELIEHWYGPLWKYVRRLTGEQGAAEDVVQDVWLRVLRGINRLRDGSKLRAWLFGIARRALMDRLRQQYAEAVVGDAELPDVAAADTGVDLDEELAAMEHKLARLPITERDVLTLFYL